jgi:hypothetical protein
VIKNRWSLRTWLWLAALGATIALGGTVLLLSQLEGTDWLPQPASPRVSNEVERITVNQLDDYLRWLTENQASGYIGETGWPVGTDHSRWNAVADVWFQAAKPHDIWVTGWAAGSHWGDYQLLLYGSRNGHSLDTASPAAGSLEAALRQPHQGRYGVNLAGLEFGNATSQNPGQPGVDYFPEPAASYNYLASRGIKLIRLPVRWERLQPELGEPLKGTEVAALRTQLDQAAAAGLSVVLDLHNYGRYRTGANELVLGTSQLTAGHVSDFWIRLTQELGNHQAVIAIGLMNEPHDLPAAEGSTSAQTWEDISQTVVNEVRRSGFHKTITVAGYDWSSLARWRSNHPRAWIQDPDANIRYEAHHYWDADGSGKYIQSFDGELSASSLRQ